MEMNLAAFLAQFLDFQSKRKEIFTQSFVGTARFTYIFGRGGNNVAT